MSTRIASVIGTRGASRPGAAGRRARRLAVPLLIAGALAAGCGTSPGGPAAGGTTAGRTATGDTAAGGTAAGGTVHASTPATPITSAAPVPTVSGGLVPAGEAACAGWPADTTSAALPASFVPVSVERCVNSVRQIPGKGLWTTATLQRSTSGLSGLITALRQPQPLRKPGTVCPALAMIPPQLVLINAAGQKLIPRLPVGDCGLTASTVLTALNQLSWQPVSVRLIAQVPGATGTAPAPTVSGPVPHPTQPGGGGHVQPQ